jgi:hypothetical protein
LFCVYGYPTIQRSTMSRFFQKTMISNPGESPLPFDNRQAPRSCWLKALPYFVLLTAINRVSHLSRWEGQTPGYRCQFKPATRKREGIEREGSPWRATRALSSSFIGLGACFISSLTSFGNSSSVLFLFHLFLALISLRCLLTILLMIRFFLFRPCL